MSKEKYYPPDWFKKQIEFVLYQDIIEIATQKDKLYTKDEMRKIIDEYNGKEA